MSENEELVWTSEHTAKAIKKSPATLARWRQKGIGPAFIRSVPGQPRSPAYYIPDTVRKWLASIEGHH